jgi:hypothetical protein
MEIDRRWEQFEKTPFSIRCSLDPDSNFTVKRRLQRTKQKRQRISTDAGRQINCSDEQFAKASPPIRRRRHPDSNSTLETYLQEAKLDREITSILSSTTKVDERPKQPTIEIVSTSRTKSSQTAKRESPVVNMVRETALEENAEPSID